MRVQTWYISFTFLSLFVSTWSLGFLFCFVVVLCPHESGILWESREFLQAWKATSPSPMQAVTLQCAPTQNIVIKGDSGWLSPMWDRSMLYGGSQLKMAQLFGSFDLTVVWKWYTLRRNPASTLEFWSFGGYLYGIWQSLGMKQQ